MDTSACGIGYSKRLRSRSYAGLVRLCEIDDAMSQGKYEALEGEHHHHDMTCSRLADEFNENWQGWSEGTWRSTGPTVLRLTTSVGQ